MSADPAYRLIAANVKLGKGVRIFGFTNAEYFVTFQANRKSYARSFS
jgi:hypothetical protein